MSTEQKKILIYRMIHYENLEDILKLGIHCANSNIQIPNYINIGNTSLISSRNSKTVEISPFGILKDYVPFYFCPRSPMLYCIHYQVNTSFYGSQSDIIYLVSSVDKIEKSGINYVFTEGHARLDFTKFFNNKNEFKNLDWEVIKSTNWSNTPDDPDRKRRKQSEFLVYKSLPLECLEGIGVHNNTMKDYVKEILTNNNKSLYTNVRKDWYY